MMIGSRAGNTGDEMEAWLCALESATRVPSIVAFDELDGKRLCRPVE